MLCFDPFWAVRPLGVRVMDRITSPPNTSMSSAPEPVTMTVHGKGGAPEIWTTLRLCFSHSNKCACACGRPRPRSHLTRSVPAPVRDHSPAMLRLSGLCFLFLFLFFLRTGNNFICYLTGRWRAPKAETASARLCQCRVMWLLGAWPSSPLLPRLSGPSTR